MEDTKVTQLTFERMRNAGFHVSVDDFGTGYSTLPLCASCLPELKIDRAFVMDLEECEDARSIAQSIVTMANALNLRVVAEGVETLGQRDLLVRMGCNELQGFLFALPMPAYELEQMAMGDQPPGSRFVAPCSPRPIWASWTEVPPASLRHILQRIVTKALAIRGQFPIVA